MAIINIGKDFSKDPAGRGDNNGTSNGKAFREDLLKVVVENLRPGENLEIILDDDVEGYGSSFLSEGFGGMVKMGYITSKDFLDILVFRYENTDFEFFEKRIRKFISTAENAQNRN